LRPFVWKQVWLESASQEASAVAEVVARDSNFIRKDGKWFLICHYMKKEKLSDKGMEGKD
jgi:hypothetical protein